MTKNHALALVAAPLFSIAGSVHAAVPADVTTALTDMKADGLIVAGLVLVAIIAVAAFGFMKRGISK